MCIMLKIGQENKDFYPTPPELIELMINMLNRKIKYNYSTILDPSAGKGDIVHKILQKSSPGTTVDCIEKDLDLQSTLLGKGYHVVHDDFLTFSTKKRYDLIMMNPPFSQGCLHLLKALKMQRRGGEIVCVLNAETIKNPYSKERQILARKLDEYNARIEIKDWLFSTAERSTGVHIAIVHVSIKKEQEDSHFFSKFKKAYSYSKKNTHPDSLTINDFLEDLLLRYKLETNTIIAFLEEYSNLAPYLFEELPESDQYDDLKRPVIEISVNDTKYNGLTYHNEIVNSALKKIREKYWTALLSNRELTSMFTEGLREKYIGLIREMVNYDFSRYNINLITQKMTAELSKGVHDTIIELFDTLSREYAYIEDNNNNIHYYNGWKSNKAHKINKKVIIPCTNLFNGSYSLNYSSYNKSNQFNFDVAYKLLADIEKSLNYLSGCVSASVNLEKELRDAIAAGRNRKINLKYFTVDFFKKGTVHITFIDTILLEKLNIYGSRKKGWLPPDYCKKEYKDLTNEEKNIINDFQGEKEYNKVYKSREFYLTLKNNYESILNAS